MGMMKIFKCAVKSCRIYTEAGKQIDVVDGRIVTDNEEDIAFIEKEIKRGHPTLYIDSEEAEIDSAHLDPMAALRAKFFKEFQESQQHKDFGSTEHSLAATLGGIGNSESVAPVAVEDSKNTAASKLAALKK